MQEEKNQRRSSQGGIAGFESFLRSHNLLLGCAERAKNLPMPTSLLCDREQNHVYICCR